MINPLDYYLEFACNTECSKFAAGECPYLYNKECCERLATIIQELDMTEEKYKKCLSFTCNLYLHMEENGKDWVFSTLRQMLTEEDSKLNIFLYYFFQAAYQMGMPLEKTIEEKPKTQDI